MVTTMPRHSATTGSVHNPDNLNPEYEPGMVFIYALSEPGTLKVRYIGQTTYPKWRLTGHITDAKKGIERNKSRPIFSWVDGLRRKGMCPDIILLTRCEESLIAAVEKEWIALFIGNGYDLLNVFGKHKDVKP